jgi:hypothetical protein
VQAGLEINVFYVFSQKEYKLGLQLMYFVYFPLKSASEACNYFTLCIFLRRVQAGLANNVFYVFSSKECKLGVQLMYFVYFPQKSTSWACN